MIPSMELLIHASEIMSFFGTVPPVFMESVVAPKRGFFNAAPSEGKEASRFMPIEASGVVERPAPKHYRYLQYSRTEMAD